MPHDDTRSRSCRRPKPPQFQNDDPLGLAASFAAHRRRRADLARHYRRAIAAENKGFTFLQISDSHMGFDKPANPNAKGTLEDAIDG